MPAAMERALKEEARKKGYTGERADRFVYGTMRKHGWKPKREMHVKGGSMHAVMEMDGDGGGEDMMYESEVLDFSNPGENCPMEMMEKRA